MLGTWIDSLTDEERDRIVEAQGWTSERFVANGKRCLIENANPGVSGRRNLTDQEWEVAGRFDGLRGRFGLPRIVRAVKQRAGHAPPVPERSEAVERNGPGAWPVTVNPNRKARA